MLRVPQHFFALTGKSGDHGFGSVDNTPAKVRLAFQLGLKSVIFAGANEIDVPPLDNINQFHKFICNYSGAQ